MKGKFNKIVTYQCISIELAIPFIGPSMLT